MVMKFTADTVNKLGARLGHITWENGPHASKILETPLCLLYTRSGSVPHLTRDVIENLMRHDVPLHLTIDSLIQSHEAIEALGKGATSFSGFGDNLSYLSTYDFLRKYITGYNDVNGIAIWTKKGRQQVDVEKFEKIVESFAPDWVQVLNDSDTNLQSTSKRIRKSVDRSLCYLDSFLERQSLSKKLQNCAIFGNIEGGFDLKQRIRSARETVARNVSGFIFDGFNRDPLIPTKDYFAKVETIITETMDIFPINKPRIIHGPFLPHQILALVEKGIDIFDSTFPIGFTDVGLALNFNFNDEIVTEEDVKKFQRDDLHRIRYALNLADKKYKSDFSPIVKNCECATCQFHTRAYLHHLYVTSELLCKVLLNIHNLHHFFTFFKAIRHCISSSRLPQLIVSLSFNEETPTAS